MTPEINPDPTREKDLPVLRANDAVSLTGDLSTKEDGVFTSLIGSFRDVFFPQKLPPLVLESKPIAVEDKMALKRDPKSTAMAVVINGAILALCIWWGAKAAGIVDKKPTINIVNLDAPPPPLPPKADAMHGGGGQPAPTPPAKGNLPKFEKNPIVPPTNTPPLDKPKIEIPPAIDMPDVKMAKTDLPNMGMPNSPLVGVSSVGGPGGKGGGLGSGQGNGLGNGSGGGTGGGVYRPGGGVSEPKPISTPEPDFSEEARKAKVAGNVLVYMHVDPNGHTSHIRILRGIGLGLDEKAMEAVRKWTFKPAMKDGKPVEVEMQVEVNFQIF